MAEISYTKTNWVNNVTKLNADNMNHIENGIEAATVEINTLNGNLAQLDEKLYGVKNIITIDSFTWESGSINSLAIATDDVSKVRTSNALKINAGSYFKMNSGYQFAIFIWNNEELTGTPIEKVIIKQQLTEYTVSVGGYARVVCGKVNQSITSNYNEFAKTAFEEFNGMGDVIVDGDINELKNSVSDLLNKSIEPFSNSYKTKEETSDFVVFTEKEPFDIETNFGSANILCRNRFDISTAIFSTGQITPVKIDNGIRLTVSPSDTSQTKFTRYHYTAEADGTIFVSCNAHCENLSDDLAVHVWFNGSAQTIARGVGRLYTSLEVTKGLDVWIDFYGALGTKHGNTCEYTDIQISYNGLYDYTQYCEIDTTKPYKISQGDIIKFETPTTVRYKYKPNNKIYNVVCFGDSITGLARNRQAYPDMIDLHDNAYSVENVGFSGSSLTDSADETLNPFCFNGLVDAIISGDFSTQSASKRVNPSETSWYSATFKEHLEKLKTIDFNKIDFVTLFYGTNDWGINAILESKDDSLHSRHSNVEDALKYCIEQLSVNYPRLRIIVITPYWRDINNNGGDSNVTPNTKGNFIYEYSDKIAEWAKDFNLPVIPLYRTCGVNKYNGKLFLIDGTHPNQVMSRLIASKIENTLNEYGA